MNWPSTGLRRNFNYDVSPNGERFVMIRPDPASELTKLRIVLNWFDELERLVP